MICSQCAQTFYGERFEWIDLKKPLDELILNSINNIYPEGLTASKSQDYIFQIELDDSNDEPKVNHSEHVHQSTTICHYDDVHRFPSLYQSSSCPNVNCSSSVTVKVRDLDILPKQIFFDVEYFDMISKTYENMADRFVYGQLTRRLYQVWFDNHLDNCDPLTSTCSNKNNNQCSPDVIPEQLNCTSTTSFTQQLIRQIQRKFHRVDLYPTGSQVFEMIQFASRCSQRQTQELHSSTSSSQQGPSCPSYLGITFGEFCFFASVLINNYNNMERTCPNQNRSTQHVRSNLDYGSRLNVDCSVTSKFDIFLGGSCNPTKWRSDQVMPELATLGITFYNPQVSDWGPELIELESYAKQNSEVLFFVIDNQTRAIASMIEVAFIAASNRKLILVIHDLEEWSPQTPVCSDYITQQEYDSLSQARQYLRDIVERREIPIFNNISKALQSAVQVLNEKIWPQDLQVSEDVIPVKNGHITLGDKIIRLYQIYNQTKNSRYNKQFTFNELPLAFKTFTGVELDRNLLQEIVNYHCESNLLQSNLSIDQIEIDFNNFCIIISELTSQINQERLDGELLENRRYIPDDISEASETTTAKASLSSQADSQLDWHKNTNTTRRTSMNRKQSTKIIGHHNTFNRNISTNSSQNSTTSNRFVEKMSNWWNHFRTIIVESSTTTITNSTTSQVKQMAKNGTNTRLNKLHAHSQSINNGHFDQQRKHNSQSSSLNCGQFGPLNHYPGNITHSNLSCHHHHDLISSQCLCAQYGRYNVFHQRKSVTPPRMIYRNHGEHGRHVSHRGRSASFMVHGHSGPSSNAVLPSHMMLHSASSQSSINSQLYENNSFDLYLGGCLDPSLMNDKIIPMLKKHSITYCLPKFDKLAKRMIPLEAINIEKCGHLLFVIPEDSLDISFMIIAAHYVGLCVYPVILCIQYIDSTKSKLASKLSETAIKDYNRGRSYLSDMATRYHVKVFDNIDEAIECSITNIIKHDKAPPNIF